jgi:hypothetical protein
MKTAPPLPLVLTLNPVLPLRAPEPGTATLTFGFQLRLPGGPAVAADDALLTAFGACVVELITGLDDQEALQDDAFAPGRRLTLLDEGVDGDGDPVVGVWDAAGVRRAGTLHYGTAAVVAAAVEQGLAVEALVLTEDRLRVDDRRTRLRLFVHAPAIVCVEPVAEDEAPAVRRLRRPRERIVLVADGSSELRWWDPSGRGGPLELDQLPLSAELVEDLKRLSAAYVRVAADDLPEDPMDGLERDMYRSSLDERMRELWVRVRAELGRRYAVGLLAPGMTRPSWSPSELADEDDDDIVFEA